MNRRNFLKLFLISLFLPIVKKMENLGDRYEWVTVYFDPFLKLERGDILLVYPPDEITGHCSYEIIKAALADAKSGDKIHIPPGTYPGIYEIPNGVEIIGASDDQLCKRGKHEST